MKKIIATTSLMRLLRQPKSCGGGVKSFVLVALAAEKDNDGGQSAACAMSGQKSEIVALVSAAGKAVMKDIVLKDLLEDLEK